MNKILISTAGVLCACQSLAFGVQPATASEGQARPQAEAILGSMGQMLSGLEQFSFVADVTYDRFGESGGLLETHERHEVSVRRPGDLRATVIGHGGALAALVRNGTLTIIDPLRNQYFQADATGTLGDAIDTMVIDLGLSLPTADLLYDNPAETLLAQATTATYAGVTPIDGVPCHHLAFSQDGLNWQVWIDSGVYPLPLRVVMQYTDLPERPRFAADLKWTLSSLPYQDTAFTFEPTSAMTQVADIESIVPNRGK
ncbi:MAG: DUF2092 domain-containing protein [Planctomycetota bacterium]